MNYIVIYFFNYPDVATPAADHGLLAELQAVVRDENGEVGVDRPAAPEKVIQVDPDGVTGNGHMTYPDLGPL